MKNNKIQFVLCFVISVLCWSNVFGKSEKMLTDSLCLDYQIEVSAEPTTLYMNIYNVTDFGPYTPDVVEWYSPDWEIDFGDSAMVVYELDVNFPPSFEMLVCADYVVDNELCTVCEWVFVGDVNSCEYELDLTISGMSIFGTVMNTAHYCPPTNVTWILEGGGGVIGNEPSLFYQFNDLGEYTICAEYSDNILGCQGVICDTIIIDGENTGSCEDEFEIDYFTEGNWGYFYLYNSNYDIFLDSISWYIDGQLAVEYGIQMDYGFPADGVYTVCAVSSLIWNVVTGELCPPVETCIDIEIVNQQNDCGGFEIFPFIDGDWGFFELSYPELYQINQDSVAWYINGQFFEYGTLMDYNFLGDGVYDICVVVPDFLNPATNEICPAQESCFTVEISNQQDNCEAFFEWQDNGNINDINTVTFANVSAGSSTDVLWDFGDGNTSTYSGANSFEHIYEELGAYNVCLTIIDTSGCQSTYCELVLVSGTPTDCDFEVQYEELDSNLFVFIFSSSNGINVTPQWLNAETQEDYGSGDVAIIYLPESGVYEICAHYETAYNACWGEICTIITVGNSACEDTDCVFPGDTNRDMIANNYDVLPIGLHFGQTGLVRSDATIDWYGQPAADWQTSADSINLKHVDCNGDGQIFFDDVDAIEQNYNRIHDGVNAMRVEGAPGLHLQFDLDTIYSAPDTGTLIINADIIMGTMYSPIEDLYGVAFSVSYPADLVDSNTVVADYFMGSWMGDPTMVLQLEKNVADQSVIDFAYSRIDQQNISGFGQIGTVSFVMTDNIIGKLASETEINFPITNVRGINSTGDEIAIMGSENVITVNLEDTTTGVPNPDLSQNIKIFPNPTSNTISMTIKDLQAQAVELYNAVGQRVLARQIATADTQQLDVSDLPSGIYLLSIQTDKGIYSEKLVISD